jgi:hypothetical protein
MGFCTVINCMDGRVQRSVLDYMLHRYQVPHVDTITAPGPNGILARCDDETALAAILRCLNVSVHKHHSVGIAVVGHYDCTGNPGDKNHQNTDTRAAVRFLRSQFPGQKIAGLWVDETWTVEEIEIP